MSIADIGTYMSDHLAGSTAAIELLQHLKSVNKDPDRGKFLIRLCLDIETNQKSLEEIMSQLHVSGSTSKRVVSWFCEKTARLKFWLDQSPESNLFWLETFEAISIGIEGQLALWNALIVSPIGSEIGPSKIEELKRRAVSQHASIEKFRLSEAKVALKRSGE